MRYENKSEVLPIVDENGNVIGSATRDECHACPNIIHPVVHLHVFNSNGLLYLQKRSMTKDLFPGYWDTSVGGHVGFGESIEIALGREAAEELRIDASGAQYISRYLWKNVHETELAYTYYIVYDGKIAPDKSEIDEGRFFTKMEIQARIGKGIYTPNFEQEFGIIKNYFTSIA